MYMCICTNATGDKVRKKSKRLETLNRVRKSSSKEVKFEQRADNVRE